MADISAERAPAALLAEVEREVARLRPAMKSVDDAAIRRALASGEAPEAAAARLVTEAEAASAAGDCAGAAARAREAEEAILAGVGIDDEREMLKRLYAMMIECESRLGNEPAAQAAGVRLRHLVSLPPSALARSLWDRYVPQAWPPAASVELAVDSDPPNAHVSIDFHGDGVTPRTRNVAPGVVIVELEKDGYKKAYRRVSVEAGKPARVIVRLLERSHDRVDQIRTSVTGLRGTNPGRRRQVLSKLCQLARVDTLVVLAAEGSKVKIWFFDADRGDLAGEPIHSPFDPATGKVQVLAQRPTPAPDAATIGSVAVPAASAAAALTAASGLPEADVRKPLTVYNPQPWRKSDYTVWSKWYPWAISAAVVAGVVLFIALDEPRVRDTLDLRARWNGPRTK